MAELGGWVRGASEAFERKAFIKESVIRREMRAPVIFLFYRCEYKTRC